jgi:hypothetical protein
MRIYTAVPGSTAKHPTRQRNPRQRLGRTVASTMLAAACALLLGGVTARAVTPPSAGLSAAASLSSSSRPGLTMVTQQPAAVPAPTPTARVPLEAPPASRPSPAATVPPGGVQGIEAPGPVNLPPVAVLPAPDQAAASGVSLVSSVLLAALLATLLIATGLTARRRL